MHHRPAFALCGARPGHRPTAAVDEAVRAMPLTSGTAKIFPPASRKGVAI